jgi:hypothetical protein
MGILEKYGVLSAHNGEVLIIPFTETSEKSLRSIVSSYSSRMRRYRMEKREDGYHIHVHVLTSPPPSTHTTIRISKKNYEKLLTCHKMGETVEDTIMRYINGNV